MILGSVAVMATDGQVYPPAVHTKFSPDGNPLRYPGNTTVCHIPAESLLLPGLWEVYNTIASHPTLSKKFRLLPPDSWHMTVFDGVREEEAEPGMWPEGLEKLPLEECTRNFSKSVKSLGLSLMAEGLAPPYKMRVNGFQLGQFGMALDIVGATEEEEKRMRRLRDRLADAFGFHAPNHLTYRFHVSIAYLIRWLESEDQAEFEKALTGWLPKIKRGFELGTVEFCTFDDMFSFPRLFYLGETAKDKALR
ncbi:RNA ligase cyclic nucleotide phosphodiesterase [Fusarium tjaetaba]|uniref:RNA ligase cyclic nucleotide phosphodiesterase n=1 Tax=Fusarium tjaetaba TaxID=1567544 RepID=A0A8H5VN01_9HYPO|nr:RNA ligase cyclic nucleotide phosphodiesterase [Fusarium tjaetaba]KAF5626794.1 RNA ligase cyclic nucleotide phosphodiesterase [Fusarium tjaetaba]